MLFLLVTRNFVPLCPVYPQDGLVTVDLGLNTSLSIGKRWVGLYLDILADFAERREKVPDAIMSLCNTNPHFLHDRA